MKDFKAISYTIKNELKQRMFGKSNYGNDDWRKADFEWYEKIHDKNGSLHNSFMKYYNEKRDSVMTVLEVGCGAGVYPIKYKENFVGQEYTGIDFSPTNVQYCKKQSQFDFITGDFIKMDIKKKYDLVFSHAVIDHVYDIDTFLINLVRSCKKFAYVNAYRGFFPDLKKHEMKWRDDDNCYYNKISIGEIHETLIKIGLTEKEIVITEHKNEEVTDGINSQLIIEINRIQG